MEEPTLPSGAMLVHWPLPLFLGIYRLAARPASLGARPVAQCYWFLAIGLGPKGPQTYNTQTMTHTKLSSHNIMTESQGTNSIMPPTQLLCFLSYSPPQHATELSILHTHFKITQPRKYTI